MMRVTQEKKLIGARSVVVAVGDIVEQLEPPDENGLICVKTSSGERGLIRNKYLGRYSYTPGSLLLTLFYPLTEVKLAREGLIWHQKFTSRVGYV